MAVTSYRGIVRDGVVVFNDASRQLSEGTEVVVTPVSIEPGAAGALLAALANSPAVPADWVDELEALIAEGHRPATNRSPFQDATN